LAAGVSTGPAMIAAVSNTETNRRIEFLPFRKLAVQGFSL
jgi:hypothetical protein